MIKNNIFLFCSVLVLFIAGCHTDESKVAAANAIKNAPVDALPSWNDGPVKTSIINYVKKINDDTSPDYIPVVDRVATFDNDGTLWAEKPVVQQLFVLYCVKKKVGKKPALKNIQPYKAIIDGDKAYLETLTEKEIIRLYAVSQTGMTQAEYNKYAEDFFATTKMPSGKTIAQLVYQPQLELLHYLRANGFKTFVCSAGSVEFMRTISQKYYGIPPEQVIGSQFEYVYKDSAGENDIVRQPAMRTFNDKQEKPVNIQYHIGKRPVFACGNEGGGGDIYMLRFSQGSSYPSLQLMVNHDDGDREFAYQEKDNKSLDWAKKYGWQVISMKNDWEVVFAKEEEKNSK